MLNNKIILITGGTGSFGNAFVSRISKLHSQKKIDYILKDEYKQFHMQKIFW